MNRDTLYTQCCILEEKIKLLQRLILHSQNSNVLYEAILNECATAQDELKLLQSTYHESTGTIVE